MLIGDGKVAAGDQRAAMFRTENPLLVSNGAFVQRNGLGGPAIVQAGTGEIPAGCQGVGVIEA